MKNGSEYFQNLTEFDQQFLYPKRQKTQRFIKQKCPEFGKLPIFKECKLLQTVVSIKN